MNILERLKHETRAEHLALEARLPLLRPDLTLEQYAAVLRAFAGVVLPLERRLAALPWPAALDYPARRHTPALQADLGALGLSAPEFALPDTLATTLPAAYGTLYVLEGSTLGG
ncbi:biliverdin-producing heme oxygenase [Deinococcus cavernae]|uniref:biliverdin-producing heme oxygenase n=1 Tax=Deinococcus cavernae TaxID=2320857 RepID=UPI0018F4774C|nr:biliverdin-producing heme oxygenase [Deinococcus cavernae]